MSEFNRTSEITPQEAVNRLADSLITQEGLKIQKETIYLDLPRLGRPNLALEILRVLSTNSPELMSDINYALVLAMQPEGFGEIYPEHMRRLNLNLKEEIKTVSEENKLPDTLNKFPLIFLESIVLTFIGYRLDEFAKHKILSQIDFLPEAVTTTSEAVTIFDSQTHLDRHHSPARTETAAD